MTKERIELGKKAEETAAVYLISQGYKIIARNYRCKLGELDIIALDGETLAFIEVRAKRSLRFGSPEESITQRKQLKLRRIAQHYLTCQYKLETSCRFDVVSICYDGLEPNSIRLYQGAF